VLKGDPGEVVLDVPIDLPRPRDPYDSKALRLERQLRDAIPDMPVGELDT
jgi:hypothetical protein